MDLACGADPLVVPETQSYLLVAKVLTKRPAMEIVVTKRI